MRAGGPRSRGDSGRITRSTNRMEKATPASSPTIPANRFAVLRSALVASRAPASSQPRTRSTASSASKSRSLVLYGTQSSFSPLPSCCGNAPPMGRGILHKSVIKTGRTVYGMEGDFSVQSENPNTVRAGLSGCAADVGILKLGSGRGLGSDDDDLAVLHLDCPPWAWRR